MKSCLCAVTTFLYSCAIFAQNRPMWLNEDYRLSFFPQEEYYIGFSQERLRGGEDVLHGLARVKSDARNKLSESIIVHVSGHTEVNNQSIRHTIGNDSLEVIDKEYHQSMTAATQSVLTNIEVQSFFDEKSSMIYAFVSVRKKDLEAYYSRMIFSNIEKARSSEEQVAFFVESGKIAKAREKVQESLECLDYAQVYFDLLSAVNPNSIVLQEQQVILSLSQRANQLFSSLDKGPSIYVVESYMCSETEEEVFNSGTILLTPQVSAALSEHHCVLVDDSFSADYVLYLYTSTSCRSKPNNGNGFLSYYANVRGQLVNMHTGKEVITFDINRNPDCFATASTPRQAGLRAFNSPMLKQLIVNKVIENIEL